MSLWPGCVMQAVWQAISAVFGSDVSVQGCFFHLTQNTWRKVQELGLAETYRNDEDVKQLTTEIGLNPTRTTPLCYNINCRQPPPG